MLRRIDCVDEGTLSDNCLLEWYSREICEYFRHITHVSCSVERGLQVTVGETVIEVHCHYLPLYIGMRQSWTVQVSDERGLRLRLCSNMDGAMMIVDDILIALRDNRSIDVIFQ